MPASWHAASTCATSCVLPGRTTSAAGPPKRPVQSRPYDAQSSGSSRTWAGPTIAARRRTRVVGGINKTLTCV